MNNLTQFTQSQTINRSIPEKNRRKLWGIGLRTGIITILILSALRASADLQYTYTYDNNLLNSYCGERVFNLANSGAMYNDGKLFGAAIIRSNTDEMYWFRGKKNALMKVFRFSGNQGYQFSIPYGVVINSAGEAYVTEIGNNRVIKLKLNLTGQVINVVNAWGAKETNKVNLSKPHGIALDKNENVYVADTGNDRIMVFDKNGKTLRTIGKSGSGDSEFNNPLDVAVSLDNVITVVDTGNGFIKQFDTSGKFLRKMSRISTIPSSYNYLSVSVDFKGNVYAIDSSNNRIYQLSPDLSSLLKTYTGIPATYIGASGIPVTPARNFSGLRSIAFDIRRNSNGTFITNDTAIVVEETSVSMFGVDSSPIAVINNLAEGDGIKKNSIVPITGTFTNTVLADNKYRIEYGAGASPARLYLIQKQTSNEVRNGVLGTWDTRNLPPGDYTVILTTSANGYDLFKSQIHVSIGDFGWQATIGDSLNVPRNISADTAGYTYVSYVNGKIIRKYDRNGKYIELGSGRIIDSKWAYFDIHYSANVLYVLDRGGKNIDKFDNKGAYLGNIDISSICTGNTISATWDKNLLVTDTNANKVFMIDQAGQKKMEIGDSSVLSRPTGIAVDSYDNLIVVSKGNNTVVKFSPVYTEGNLPIRGYTVYRVIGKDYLKSPTDVTIEGMFTICVTDTLNGRVVFFKPGGEIFYEYYGERAGDVNSRIMFKNPEGLSIDNLAGLSTNVKQNFYVMDQLKDKYIVYGLAVNLPPIVYAAKTVNVKGVVKITGVQLSWNAGANVYEYDVMRKLKTDKKFLLLAKLPTTSLSYEDRNIKSNERYEYCVIAVDNLGNFGNIDEATVVQVSITKFTGNITALTAPGDLKAVPMGNKISLSWADKSSGESGFKIERKKGVNGTYVQIGTTGANAKKYVDMAAEKGVTFYYRVKAYNRDVESVYSNESSAGLSAGNVPTGSPQVVNVRAHSTIIKTGKLSVYYDSNIVSGSMLLEVYNMGGRKVAERAYPAGIPGTNAIELETKGLAPGVYYYTLRSSVDTGTKPAVKTFIVVK